MPTDLPVTLHGIQKVLCQGTTITRETLLGWMDSPDADVRGYVADLLTYHPGALRVAPPLEHDDYARLLLPYYEERLLADEPYGEYSLSRYGVAHAVHEWFEAAPPGESVNSQGFLGKLKAWMAARYTTGDEEVRSAIVAGALEHILEEPRWRAFFADWRDHPVLSRAYNAAMEWAIEHER